MNIDKAISIFRNIFNSNEWDTEKMEAIYTVVQGRMPFNSITKQEYVNALAWICENYEFIIKEY